MLMPIMPFQALSFGGNAADVGLLGTIFAVAQIVSVPLWGALLDRYGFRKVMIWNHLGLALAYAIIAFAPSLFWLVLGRFINGASYVTLLAAQVYVAASPDPRERGRAMARVGAAFSLGLTLGPWIGGHPLLQITRQLGLGYQGVGAVSVLLCMGVAWLVASTLPSEARKSNPPELIFTPDLKPLLNSHTLTVLCLILAASILVAAQVEWTLALLIHQRLPLLTTDQSTAATGYGFALLGGTCSIAQILVARGRIAHSEISGVRWGLAATLVGLLFLAMAHSAITLGFATLCLGIGTGLILPHVAALVSGLCAAEQQGSTLGLMQWVGCIGRMLGSLSGGLFFQHLGAATCYLSSAVVIVILFVLTRFPRLQLMPKSE